MHLHKLSIFLIIIQVHHVLSNEVREIYWKTKISFFKKLKKQRYFNQILCLRRALEHGAARLMQKGWAIFDDFFIAISAF